MAVQRFPKNTSLQGMQPWRDSADEACGKGLPGWVAR